MAAAAPGAPAASLPALRPPQPSIRPVPPHPDDLIHPRKLTDAQLDAAFKRAVLREQAAEAREQQARDRGGGPPPG